MSDFPPMPPLPDEDVDWTEIPNEWDLAMMEYREKLEEFGRQLRAQWRLWSWNSVPPFEYKSGTYKMKWEGELYPISKPFYSWLHAHDFGSNQSAWETLRELLMARGIYTTQASK